jgi:glutaconate CoA-transferase subunit B
MYELFAYYLQAELIDVGFLGASQIDRFGNINTTVIGDYGKPKARLPSSGGACEIASTRGRRSTSSARIVMPMAAGTGP